MDDPELEDYTRYTDLPVPSALSLMLSDLWFDLKKDWRESSDGLLYIAFMAAIIFFFAAF